MFASAAKTLAVVTASLAPEPTPVSPDVAALNALVAPSAVAVASFEPGAQSTRPQGQDPKPQTPPAPTAKEKPETTKGPTPTPVSTGSTTGTDASKGTGQQDPAKSSGTGTPPTQDPKPGASSTAGDLLRRAQQQKAPQAPATPEAAAKAKPEATQPAAPANPQPGQKVTPANQEPAPAAASPQVKPELKLDDALKVTPEQFLALPPAKAREVLIALTKGLESTQAEVTNLGNDIELANRIQGILDAARREGGSAQFSALQEIRSELKQRDQELALRRDDLSRREKERQGQGVSGVPQPIADLVRDVNEDRANLKREVGELSEEFANRREEFLRYYNERLRELDREKQQVVVSVGGIINAIGGKDTDALVPKPRTLINGIVLPQESEKYKDVIAQALQPIDVKAAMAVVFGGKPVESIPNGPAEKLLASFLETRESLSYLLEQRDGMRGTRSAQEELASRVVAEADRPQILAEVRTLLSSSNRQQQMALNLERKERELNTAPGDLTEVQQIGLDRLRQLEYATTELGRSALNQGRDVIWLEFGKAETERDKVYEAKQREIDNIRNPRIGG